ncbi:MAG: GNAT family N-acetyltransferase [Ginsengibacter sp.]
MTETLHHGDIEFKIATTSLEFGDAKNLFQLYAASLEIDLSFQNFSDELETIDKQYNKPTGALLLAYINETAVACAGIRQLDVETAELKRMYVQPAYRQHRLGRKLLERIVAIARERHYKRIRLDTLPTMTRAQNLYRSFGFYEVPSYRFNPVSGAVFMEKKLS